jgi:hypothetical protein
MTVKIVFTLSFTLSIYAQKERIIPYFR